MAPLKFLAGILRRFRWLIAAIIAVAVAYTAAGFLLVPYLAKSSIEKYVQQDLKRHVKIGKLTFNPFTFTTEVAGFALTEADNAPVASFDLLHVDFEVASIFNRAWTFKEVRLEHPDLRVLVNSDGTLNLSKLQPATTAPQPAPATPAQMPAVRIGTLAVHQGIVGLEDRSRPMPFATRLTPIEFTLTDFRTAPNFQNVYRFQGSTQAGEKLAWSGQFSVQPLGSTGKFQVSDFKAATIASYLQDMLPFDMRSGAVDLEGDYRVALTDKFGLTVDLPTLKLRDFAIAPKGINTSQPWISLPAVEISGTALSLDEQKIAVDRIQVDNAKWSVWREADGQLNLPLLFVARQAAGVPASSVARVGSAAPAAAPVWAIGVNTVEIRTASLDVEDRMVTPAVKFNVTPVSLTVTGYSTAPGNVVKVDSSLTVGGKGRIHLQGDFKLVPMAVNLAVDVTDFELPPLQPYVASATALQLFSGQFSTKAKISMNAAPAKNEPGMQFSGDVTVANLATRDAASRQDFVKWQSLRLAGINYQQGPDRLSIDRIEARRPYGRVFITADQNINIATVLNPPKPGQATPKAVAAPPPQAAPAKPAPSRTAKANAPKTAAAPARAAATAPMPIRIRTITIQDGSANFADFSIEPNFAAGIVALNGTITGLSSDPASRAQVKLNGNVDRYAPVDITGTVNVLSAAVFTDIAMNFRNMELTSFNPYSGKYAGYNISKGKLTTELHYKVDNRKLDAQHHIVLDQLEFGGATESKDAVPLPVRLAVALLKDSNGVIDLNLPITGSLDDPQFRVGPIIWQAVIGLLTKIVTAPFALLGSLFGGGEELAYIDFSPGSAMLATAEQEKIGKLTMALTMRPQLKLDIPLQTLSAADDAALSKAAFDAAVAQAQPPAPMGMPAGPAQRLAALSQLYQQQIGMMPMFPMPVSMEADVTGANIAFLEEALKPKFAASAEQRSMLARARADAVQAAILADMAVMPERVFLTERESSKGGEGGAARMELNLQ